MQFGRKFIFCQIEIIVVDQSDDMTLGGLNFGHKLGFQHSHRRLHRPKLKLRSILMIQKSIQPNYSK